MREGGDDQTVVVTSNFPPAVFCDIKSNETCSIFIGFEVTDSAEDIRCPSSNETLPQLVLRWSDENSAVMCGVMLTNENWQLAQSVIVRAVVDGKTDGDQERSVVVMATLTHNITVSVSGFTVSFLFLFTHNITIVIGTTLLQ